MTGRHDTHQIDSAVLAEVCQKLSVTSSEVIAAIRSGDRGHHLAVAYELVQDNRYMIYELVQDNRYMIYELVQDNRYMIYELVQDNRYMIYELVQDNRYMINIYV